MIDPISAPSWDVFPADDGTIYVTFATGVFGFSTLDASGMTGDIAADMYAYGVAGGYAYGKGRVDGEYAWVRTDSSGVLEELGPFPEDVPSGFDVQIGSLLAGTQYEPGGKTGLTTLDLTTGSSTYEVVDGN